MLKIHVTSNATKPHGNLFSAHSPVFSRLTVILLINHGRCGQICMEKYFYIVMRMSEGSPESPDITISIRGSLTCHSVNTHFYFLFITVPLFFQETWCPHLRPIQITFVKCFLNKTPTLLKATCHFAIGNFFAQKLAYIEACLIAQNDP